MARNNLVYDPAAQMYRQNPLDPNSAAFGQIYEVEGGPILTGTSSATADQPDTSGPQQNYPAWLTDLSARGLASDWKPAAFVKTAADELHPRDIPPDAPVTAQAAPLSADTNTAPTSFSGGQEGGGDASNAAGGGGGPADVGSSSDASGGVGSSGDSGSSGGGAGDASGGSADAGSDSGGDGGFSLGGIVSPNKLVGPNPPGPDTGFGALKPGEGVLTDKAMKFYGKGIIAKLNRLAIAKEAFR